MNVSVITLVRIHNYGSVLQAYATSRLIELLGHTPSFVDLVATNGGRLSTLRDNLDARGLRGARRIAYYLAWNVNWLVQERVFGTFVNKRLAFGARYHTVAELYRNPPSADIYLSGSDMLWSTKLNKGHEQKQFYLDWAPEGKKRIAYAASIGEEEIPKEEQDFLAPLLGRYDYISMRERSGVSLLKKMGIDSVNVLDPTLALPKDEWLKLISGMPRRRPYLLVYFLHEHEKVFAQAVQYARQRGLDVVRIAFQPKKRPYDDKIELMPSIGRFLALFAFASYVVTDSFHGTAFSLIFEREFLCTDPPRYRTRLDSILEITGLEDRVIRDYDRPIESYQGIDYAPVNIRLEEERARSSRFLMSALRI